MPELTVERLKEVLHYDSDTGFFTWLLIRGSLIRKGDTAGSPDKDGYLRIMVDGVRYRAHRLAWFYVYGVWPRNEIDHINRVKDANWIGNLREATSWQNGQNRPLQTNNTSGYPGVRATRSGKRWTAKIQHRGRSRHLGTFSSAAEAHSAYTAAGRSLHTYQCEEPK